MNTVPRQCSFHQQEEKESGNGTHYSFSPFPVGNWFSKAEDGNMSRNGFDNPFTFLARLNFANFCKKIGTDPRENICISPKHKSDIVIVEKSGLPIECDGLFTKKPGLSLSLLPADCFPVVFTDKNGSFVGLVHGGGKSVELGIIEKAVRLANEFSANPKDLIVAIGPGIGAWSCEQNDKHHTKLLDKILKQLWNSGIEKKGIILSYLCTYCAKDIDGLPLFFSHNRNPLLCQRFAVVVKMKPF